MPIKIEELKPGIIVHYKWELHKIIRVNKKSIIIENLDEENVKVQRSKGWNHKFALTEVEIHDFDHKKALKVKDRCLMEKNCEIRKLKRQLEEATREPEYPFGYHIREVQLNCSDGYLKKLLAAVEPIADSVQMSYGRNTEGTNQQYWYKITEVNRKCNRDRLFKILECLFPVADGIFLSWWRREE